MKLSKLLGATMIAGDIARGAPTGVAVAPEAPTSTPAPGSGRDGSPPPPAGSR
jgi:hypothetical protein